MARLHLMGWSRLACAGALTALIAVACGGESEADDTGTSGGKGGSAGSSGKGGAGTSGSSSAGKGGSSNGGSAGTAGSSSGSAGRTAGTAGTDTNGGETGEGGGGGTGGKGGSAGSGGAPPDIPINQTCETFEPCGGDPEGSWRVVETCLATPGELPLLDQPGCEEAVQGVGVQVEGTRTFEGGEVTFEQTATARVAVIVSDECATSVTMSDMQVDAEQLCSFLPALVALQMDSPFDPVLCEVMDGECHCDLYMNVETTTTTTTYTVDGSHITQSDGAEYDFCQEGDSLIIHGLQESDVSEVVNELTVEYERE